MSLWGLSVVDDRSQDGQALPLCSCPVNSSLGGLVLQDKAAAKALKVQKAKAKEQERNKAKAKPKEEGAADANKTKLMKEAEAKKVNVQPRNPPRTACCTMHSRTAVL